MKRAARSTEGSVVWNKKYGTWNYLWFEEGRRRSKVLGTLDDFPTRQQALRAAETIRGALGQPVDDCLPTVRSLVVDYRRERMPERYSTRLGYEAWLQNYILPRWGKELIVAMQPRAVELWLKSLSLSPKSKVHIRGLIRSLWEYAMWRGAVSAQRNPMELVTIKGATKRDRKPRSLNEEEFRKFLEKLPEPFHTMALVSVCLGLRISECLGLKWSDVDWLNRRLRVERAIVRQRVDAVKTEYSERMMPIDVKLLEVLATWKQTTEFPAGEDWMFASPYQLGRLPWSYPCVWRVFRAAAGAAGVSKFGTHTLRHTYRSWLDAVGTPVATQQKLMRHADIRTTMNTYGDVVTDEESQALSKVAQVAFPKPAAAVPKPATVPVRPAAVH